MNATNEHEPRVDPALRVEPVEVVLEPIEVIWRQAAKKEHGSAPSSQVHIWPMLAAALVALGVAMVALATFAKFMRF